MIDRRHVPFAAVALATLAVTGCSATPDSTVVPHRTSIAELFGQDTQYSPEQYQEQEAQMQDLIAECMTQKGWEYIPVQYPDNFYEYSGEDERERREREGYGIAYWTLNRGNEPVPVDPGPEWVDPNQAYIESLTESERGAYTEDLYGDAMLYSDSEMTVESSAKIAPSVAPGDFNTGCMGEASEVVYGVTPDHSQEYWDAQSRFYEELNTRVLSDPRIKALDGEWSACMKNAGYDYATPSAIWDTAYTELQARHDEIVGPEYYADPFEGWSQEELDNFWATATQEQIDAMYNQQAELTDAQRQALEALLADEIDLAVAEYDCTTPYNEKYQDFSSQIEEQYALEHQAEIEALVASEPG